MTTFDERKSKSFDVVLDTIKLIITLSTAIIGYFTSSIIFNENNQKQILQLFKFPIYIKLTLIFFSLSVFFALSSILKISGVLGNKYVNDKDVTIYDPGNRLFYSLSLIFFFIGVILLGYVAFSSIDNLYVSPKK
ncbi:hypothetical protein GR160_01680 [Flavobacterium sp. Sd200]|uniref:hypothetical protein n=1 Tax=Flavobacterium sp. Sd200 TaxID=2692211 RepID=UPI0013696513|nr:hypothetical protein [Flavobacterium sp. Sd200]MXN89924.1 hypothetical protein [Flavobacterium sp. Sd200]